MKKTTPLRLALMLALGTGIAAACANTSSDAGTDSSTHWLDQCRTDADCGGLECECGLCTKRCHTPGDCKGLSASASCAPVSGCSSATAVCLRPSEDAGQPSSGGDCPSDAAASDHCDGRIEQCWLPCRNGLRGQLSCFSGTWIAGKGLFPCGGGTGGAGNGTGGAGNGTGGAGNGTGGAGNGTGGAGTTGGDCPASTQGGASCDGKIEQCWTLCNGGFRGQFVCSDGTWLAGHGLFPCGADAGTPEQDAGDPPFPGVSTSCTQSADCYAANRTCCVRCDLQPTTSTKVGVALTSSSVYNGELCSNAEACPPCVPPPGTIDSFCRAGKCDVEDLGKYKACTKDADCKLVPKDCCACGTLPATAFAVVSDESGYYGELCGFGDCEPCPDGIHVADASRATCNTTYGYCEIAPPR